MFTTDIFVRGKHATYLKYLSKKTEQNDKKSKTAGVFARNIDVYMAAAVIGVAKCLRAEEDNSVNDSTKLDLEIVLKAQSNLIAIFNMVMLVDNSRGLTPDQKIEKTFRNPDEDPANMKIFNAYVRGGIGWLYEQFTTGATTKDEYLEKIFDIVNQFNDENI